MSAALQTVKCASYLMGMYRDLYTQVENWALKAEVNLRLFESHFVAQQCRHIAEVTIVHCGHSDVTAVGYL